MQCGELVDQKPATVADKDVVHMGAPLLPGGPALAVRHIGDGLGSGDHCFRSFAEGSDASCDLLKNSRALGVRSPRAARQKMDVGKVNQSYGENLGLAHVCGSHGVLRAAFEPHEPSSDTWHTALS